MIGVHMSGYTSAFHENDTYVLAVILSLDTYWLLMLLPLNTDVLGLECR